MFEFLILLSNGSEHNGCLPLAVFTHIGIFMDEVMLRTVNTVMSELLKNNKVTLLSIFASAAANQTAAAVKSLARYLFKGSKE